MDECWFIMSGKCAASSLLYGLYDELAKTDDPATRCETILGTEANRLTFGLPINSCLVSIIRRNN